MYKCPSRLSHVFSYYGEEPSLVAYEAPERLDVKLSMQFIYLIQCGEYVKIGIATDPHKRIQELQIGNPQTLRLLHVLLSLDAAADERLLHSRLSDYYVRGEWYQLPERLLRWLCARHCLPELHD